MTAFLMAAFLTVFAVLMVVVPITVRADPIARYDAGLEQLDEQIRTDRHCAQFSHNMRKVPTPTVWRCTVCGEEWESMPGWVGESA